MRYLISTAAGLGVALLLFLFMHALISGGPGFDSGAAAGKVLEFIRIKPDEITQLKERVRPKKPPEPKKPPPPPKVKVANTGKPPPVALNMEMPTVSVPVSAGSGPYIGQWRTGDPAAEGDVIPIVRIDPQWPREALLSGIEGWVLVEFTITEDGGVEDPDVLESEPRRMFDRNAIRAILKWKFKPRIIDGKPVRRRATQRIDFELDS